MDILMFELSTLIFMLLLKVTYRYELVIFLIYHYYSLSKNSVFLLCLIIFLEFHNGTEFLDRE